jgi:O-antigen ligase
MVPTITSVFENPNQLGAIALVGTIAAFEEYWSTQSYTATVLLGANLIGLFFSDYRTWWLVLLAVGSLFVVYSLFGRKWTLLAALGRFSTMGVMLLIAFGVIPGPAMLTELSLNNRRELWTISFHALQERPLVGHGFMGTADYVGNPHNSFIRAFVAFGVIGGVVYTLFVLWVAVGSVRDANTKLRFVLAALLVAFVFVQITNQLTFIGISMRSSLIAIAIGYYLSSGQHRGSDASILDTRDRATSH